MSLALQLLEGNAKRALSSGHSVSLAARTRETRRAVDDARAGVLGHNDEPIRAALERTGPLNSVTLASLGQVCGEALPSHSSCGAGNPLRGGLRRSHFAAFDGTPLSIIRRS